MFERCASSIELVYKTNTRDFCFVGISPVCFRLRLYTSDTVENNDSSVEHAKRTLHFHCEINVPWGVNNIKTMLFAFVSRRICRNPKTSHCGGGNGDAALSFLLHPVCRRLAFVHLADFVLGAGIKKHAFGRGGLPRINVRDDSKISNFF